MNPALLTDLYQLTMACGYFDAGVAETEANFHLVFRRNPFGGGFTIACGLEQAVASLGQLAYGPDELDYLASLSGGDGRPLFSRSFLDQLAGWQLACSLDAIPEGTVVFPREPLLRVRGPLWQCQLLETLLLNQLNFPTLVATRAARVRLAAGSDPVLEFGLRRAQGPDGAMTASRAAFLGGCTATSNVAAGRRWGIPVRGTHAHSWVLAFDDEPAAFAAFARAMPHNCILLVDTFDTMTGVEHAIALGRQMQETGGSLAGIRLDSGDLASLAREARDRLDAAGLADVPIVASNDLDEHSVARLKEQGVPIAVWGIGTRLVTAWDEPALGGVYKLTAIRDGSGTWQPRLKTSDDPDKTSDPGLLQVRRFRDENGRMAADVLYGLTDDAPPDLPAGMASEDLLEPIIRDGVACWDAPPLEELRERTLSQLDDLPPGVRRLESPEFYPVRLSEAVAATKRILVNNPRPATAAPTR